ncbi:MAG: acyl-CoA dehydrogenase [Alteromonadaceae bacterium TMED7]|nr:MAG: acyl-CoA dehydrogenase [Alteromonadaceae bacterium TMED7]|tara:strand:- start:20686 stop:21816 length:1131 start_codon:yes stop_codon:yes gene_type:complete
MNSASLSNQENDFWEDDIKVLSDVEEVAKSHLAPEVNNIDQKGYYPVSEMKSLGEVGAFSPHLNAYGQRFDLAIANMKAISRQCGSTGFMTWCQDVCGMYMELSENPALINRLFDHASGKFLGGTGLSNPMKAFTNIEAMALRATKTEGGYLVSGMLPWVSHITRGQYCGAIAAIDNKDGSRSHEVMFLLDINEHVTLNKCPEFSGMEGTSTWGISLTNYFVSEAQIIADPAKPFIKKIRGAFILLQTGWACGVIQASIDACREVETSLGHVNQFLHNRPDELEAEFEELEKRINILAQSPYDISKEHLIDILDIRAQCSELSLKASQSALLHQGARGYLMKSKPQRLIREAHFVAIVTPAIKHLRWEIAKLMSER